jgi:hypothetical protein
MRFLLVLAPFTVVGGLAGCTTEDPLVATRTDPLGVSLDAVGIAGDQPCVGREHVASVLDEAGRYMAFCRGATGAISTLSVAPVGLPELGRGQADPLGAYLAITDEGADVPAALVSAARTAEVRQRGRTIVAAPVVEVATRATTEAAVVLTACTTPALFQAYCDAIDAWATGRIHATVCDLDANTGAARRTASAQLDSGAPTDGRTTVAACGTASTQLRHEVYATRWETWVISANHVIAPNKIVTTTISLDDYTEPDGVGGFYTGGDLRVRILPASGAFYRYASGFVGVIPPG